MRTLALVALAAVLAPSAAFADTTQDIQAWNSTTLSTEIAPDLTLSGDTVVKISDDRGGLSQIHVGASLAYKLRNGLELTAGFDHIPNYSHGSTTSVEERPWQQISGPIAKLGNGSVAFRVRLEERWRNTGDDMGARGRIRVRYTVPLHHEGKTKFYADHESFIALNDTDWGQRSGYSFMRNGAGFSFPVGGKATLGIGYLNQYTFGSAGKSDEMAHILNTSVGIKF